MFGKICVAQLTEQPAAPASLPPLELLLPTPAPPLLLLPALPPLLVLPLPVPPPLLLLLLPPWMFTRGEGNVLPVSPPGGP